MAKKKNNIPDSEIITLGIPSETPDLPEGTDVIIPKKLTSQSKKASKSITPYEPAEDIDDINDVEPPEGMHISNLESLFDEKAENTVTQDDENTFSLTEEYEPLPETEPASGKDNAEEETFPNEAEDEIDLLPEESPDTKIVARDSVDSEETKEETTETNTQADDENPQVDDDEEDRHSPTPVPEETEEIGEEFLSLLSGLSSQPDVPKYNLKSLLNGKIFDLSEENVVGKGLDSDIRLSSEFVSKNHALITIENGEVYIEDLDSRNGTFYQNERICEKTRIAPGDSITFGDEVCILEDGAAEKKELTELSLMRKDTGEIFEIFDGMKIGRKYYNDVVIPRPEGEYVSAKHATIGIDGENIILTDNDSSNGTYVNGKEIKSESIYEGDTVRFADIEFKVIQNNF